MQQAVKIDLVKLWQVINQHKKQISLITLIPTILALIYCIFATPIFTAKVLINPPKLSDAGSGVTQLLAGNLATMGMSGGFWGQKTDSDIATAMFKTNQLKTMVIKQLNLLKHYNAHNMDGARGHLGGAVRFIPDMKSGFLEIDVDDRSPQIAADIANYYVIALGQLISNVAYSRSIHKQEFFLQQIAVSRNNLALAQAKLKEFALQHGIASGMQMEVVTKLSMQLQTQLVVAQSKLRSMSLYATPNNPDYKKLQAEIDGLHQQLDAISGQASSIDDDQLLVPPGLTPELSAQYLNLMRDILLNEEVLKVLSKQYEAAKIDAMSELVPTAVEVIDPALVPTHKSKPKRFLILSGVFSLSLMISCIYFLIRRRNEFVVES